MPKKNKLHSKKSILISTLTLLTVGIGIYYAVVHRNNKDVSEALIQTEETGYINLSPPTEQDAQEADQNKERISQPEKEEEPDDPSTNSASLIITYAGQYNGDVEAASFVQGTFEDGGRCIYALSKDLVIIEKTSTGVADVSNTLCPAVKFPRTEIPSPGDWNLKVTYESASTAAASDVKVISVE